MHHAAEMRRCLEDLDVVAVRRLWRHVAPNMPQPKSDSDALIILHHARTQSAVVLLKHRAYSHRWLCDRGLPSGLPDNLKPHAERMYPKIVGSVGISVNSKYRQVREEIHDAMADVVENAYADRKEDPEYIKPRMREARFRAQKRLGL